MYAYKCIHIYFHNDSTPRRATEFSCALAVANVSEVSNWSGFGTSFNYEVRTNSGTIGLDGTCYGSKII